jgi:energy-coupling factor transport system substrate-specific component
MFGLSFDEMLVWIAAGSLFDIVHGVSNFFCGALVLPVVKVLKRLSGK